jgi:hypothetical protein
MEKKPPVRLGPQTVITRANGTALSNHSSSRYLVHWPCSGMRALRSPPTPTREDVAFCGPNPIL